MEETKNTNFDQLPIRGYNWKRGKTGSARCLLSEVPCQNWTWPLFWVSEMPSQCYFLSTGSCQTRCGPAQKRKRRGTGWDDRVGRWSFRWGSLHPCPQFNFLIGFIEVGLENHIPSLLTLFTSVKLLYCKLAEDNSWIYLGTSNP